MTKGHRLEQYLTLESIDKTESEIVVSSFV